MDTFTVACNLEKLLVSTGHVAIVRDAAERAHAATRLASRLLNFHLRKCLECDLPLPAFGHEHWLYKAWNAVTRASRSAPNAKPDAELLATLAEFMPGTQPVDSTKLVDIMHFEARRWAATATTNIYRHFAKRVQKHVRAVYRMEKEAFAALTQPQKLARKTALTRVTFDLCSPPTNALTCPPEYQPFVTTTRVEWKLGDFPWDGKPLAYHQKANSTTNPRQCHAHLLLPAMHRMLLRREADGDRGFALLPMRTTLVPRHTQFGSDVLRSLLGVGGSEHRKAKACERDAERRKKQKTGAGTSSAPVDEHDDDLELPPLTANPSPTPTAAASSSTDPVEPPPTKKRTNRPKAECEAEKRADLAHLFDLERAGVHGCRDKVFDCTFTSDGYAAHLQFKRPKPAGISNDAFPRKGIWPIEELRRRLKTSATSPNSSIDALKSPKAKLHKLCTPCGCCVSDTTLGQPFEDLICVGCDPGKNEPANMVDPLTRATLRMTASGRRHATTPGNWHRTNRHVLQSIHNGKAREHLDRDKAATAYRQQYVNKPVHIGQLESEMGQLSCATSASLLDFRTYIDVLVEREPVLVPHYQQVYHRKLRFKGHIERQRFESRFIRDIKATFDPGKTNKVVLIAWGAWGKIAGRPGGVGNKGQPPTIGVGLAQRIAKEDGIVIAWTPEHYTTKTCFECGGRCDRATQAEERRRTDTGFRRHVKEIRGLKRCTGCHRHVNRDLNAAKNIAVNGMLLLAGHAPIAVHTEAETQLLQLENDMLGAP